MSTTHAMIDLFFPSSAGSVAEAQAKAAEAGLEGLIYVGHHPDDLPNDDEWSREEGQPLVLLGCAVIGAGYRMAVLVEDWEDANFEVLEATDDLNLLVTAVSEMGGAAYAVCPHQTDEGEVVRQAARLADGSSAGVLALVADANALARDLDIEQASRAERRIFGGTGPFGALSDVGRYATFMTTESIDASGIIAAVNDGLGVAAEIGDHRQRRDSGGGGGDKKRRRRRRRRNRGPRGDGDGDGGDGGE